jgi:hypothetical protein
MNKRKTARVAAFIGALGASAALIASAVGTTGAYFTDSKDGSLAGSTGHIKIDVSGQNLAFTGLMPGDYQTKTVAYSTNNTDKSDVWMVFNPNDPAYQALTGAKGNALASGGGLGGLGHFAVFNNGDQQLFSSWNLQNLNDTTSGCADPATGHGGNGANSDYIYNHGFRNPHPAGEVPGPNDVNCGIPQAILLDSNLPTGDYHFKVIFGITPRATTSQDAPWTGTVPFKVVATQPGVSPTGDFIKATDKF